METYEVLIVGGGISGSSAAMYTAYAGLKTLVIDSGKSQILKVGNLQNYPGIKETISGNQLMTTMKEQAKSFNADWLDDEVIDVKQKDAGFILKTTNGQEFFTTYLIIATNVNVNLLEKLGLTVVVNEKVPSGKVKKVVDVSWDGVTSIENLYVIGLLAGLPTQAVIASGQGTAVATEIASKHLGKQFVWHDV